MLQRIATTQALAALQTRSDDDYAITLLDMWATVADVLTFYQERIANESLSSDCVAARFCAADGADARLPPAPGNFRHHFPGIYFGQRRRRYGSPSGFGCRAFRPRMNSRKSTKRLNRSWLMRTSTAAESCPRRKPLTRWQKEAPRVCSPLDRKDSNRQRRYHPGDRLILLVPDSKSLLCVKCASMNAVSPYCGRGRFRIRSGLSHSSMRAFNRTFHIFGHNAPQHYMEPEEIPANSGNFV